MKVKAESFRRLAIGFIAVCFVVIAAARDLDEALERANAAQSGRDFDAAITAWDDVLKLDPHYSNAYRHRGIAYFRLGNSTNALSDYSKAIELNPKDHEAYNGRGYVRYEQRDFEKAMRDFDEAIRLNSKSFTYFRNRGLALDSQGKTDEAITDFTKALNLNSRDAWTLLNRGDAYEWQGEYDRAIADYNKALSINPTYRAAYVHRAQAYAGKKDYEKAIEDFDKALRLDPKDGWTYNQRGHIFVRQKKTEQALADYTRAIALTNGSAYWSRSTLYRSLGEFDKAIADINSILQKDPNTTNAWPYLCRAKLFQLKGDFTNAVEDLNRAAHCEPTNELVLFDLAYFRAACPDAAFRDGKEAVKLAEKVCAMFEWKDYSTIEILAAAYAETKDFEQAVKYQTQALSMSDISPKDRDVAQQRLELYRKQQPLREINKLWHRI